MTTLFIFHPLIEASETSATVLSLFGQLFDGDAEDVGRIMSSLVGAGGLVGPGGLIGKGG